MNARSTRNLPRATEMLYIQSPTSVSDCGACGTGLPGRGDLLRRCMCPNGPDYYAANVEFFDVGGPTRRAAKIGQIPGRPLHWSPFLYLGRETGPDTSPETNWTATDAGDEDECTLPTTTGL
jgi:hypothetical protein